MKRIYLDFASTTPLDQKVAKAMDEFGKIYWGNPSSQHREGQAARAKIDFAREEIAALLNAKPQQIIFTSGATEANNLTIQGTVSHYIKQYNIKPRVITTMLEHHSVFTTVKELKERGVIDATFIHPSKDGLIKAEDVIKAITENTVLISIIFVSNEIGSVLPVREIGSLIKEHNKRQKMPVMYHIDAVQAVKYHNCNAEKLSCDFLTISPHKFYGPKGIAALFIKSGVKLSNLMYGGNQEYGLRPGTQNTSGIIGFAESVKLLGSLDDRLESGKKIVVLRDKLIALISKIDDVSLNGPTGEERIPDNVNFSVFDVEQDSLMTALDLAGIAASTGSACVSGASEPSHVIESLGKVGNRTAATIRLTLGRSTSEEEINKTAQTLTKIIKQLRNEK